MIIVTITPRIGKREIKLSFDQDGLELFCKDGGDENLVKVLQELLFEDFNGVVGFPPEHLEQEAGTVYHLDAILSYLTQNLGCNVKMEFAT